MPSILSITAALALFTLSLAYSLAEVEVGRIPGFTGGSHYYRKGDYLLNTYCFCTDPTPTPENYTEASYIQIEYFNYHTDITYILSNLCLAHEGSGATCFAPQTTPALSYHNGNHISPLCRTWYSDVDVDSRPFLVWHDTLCYDWSDRDDHWREFRLPSPDVITFNGQHRHLDPLGRQGPLLRSKEEADGKCGVMCREHAGMEVLRGVERAASHIISWEDLDDMCHGCG